MHLFQSIVIDDENVKVVSGDEVLDDGFVRIEEGWNVC